MMIVCILGLTFACDMRKQTIVLGASIRFIHNPDDLSDGNIDRSSTPTIAHSLRDIADLQAEQWESSPTLIWIVPTGQVLHLRRTKVRRGNEVVKGNTCRVITWLFVYKKAGQDAVLCVKADAHGVLDVGKSKDIGGLRSWESISGWTVDDAGLPALSIANEENGSCAYELLGLGDTYHSFWLTRSNGWLYSPRAFDASSGYEVSQSTATFLASRPILWESLKKTVVTVVE